MTKITCILQLKKQNLPNAQVKCLLEQLWFFSRLINKPDNRLLSLALLPKGTIVANFTTIRADTPS